MESTISPQKGVSILGCNVVKDGLDFIHKIRFCGGFIVAEVNLVNWRQSLLLCPLPEIPEFIPFLLPWKLYMLRQMPPTAAGVTASNFYGGPCLLEEWMSHQGSLGCWSCLRAVPPGPELGLYRQSSLQLSGTPTRRLWWCLFWRRPW